MFLSCRVYFLGLDKVHVHNREIVGIAMTDSAGLDVVNEIGLVERMRIRRRIVMAGDARGPRWKNFADEGHAVVLRDDCGNRF